MREPLPTRRDWTRTGVRWLRLAWSLILLMVLGGAGGGVAAAQQGSPIVGNETGPTSNQQIDSPSASGSSPVSATSAFRDGNSGDLASGTTITLSAAQIVRILQQNPDLTVELKQQLAERLTRSGQPVDANSITDEQLFAQIGNNPNLRAGITTFLRARGYVSQDDLLEAQEAQIAGRAGELPSAALAAGVDTQSADGLALQQDVDAEGTSPRRSLANSRGQEAASRPARREQVHGSTDEPRVLRRAAPYNLQSLRDVYTQIPVDDTPLKRFGSDVFLNRSVSAAIGRGTISTDAPLDVPLGPDYVLGGGDTLTISMWGATTQSVIRTVARDGTVLLPEAGQVQLAGLTLGRAQEVVASALRGQFRDAKASVTVSRLRSVRVYVTGDVQRPGGYDLSSLATPVSALYAAGGPTAAGSLRTVQHLRRDRMVEQVDLYDFLLHGVREDSVHFENGDTLQVPPAGRQVAISGAVRRPAIYELASERPLHDETLATVLLDAGGLTAAASLEHVTVERVDPQSERSTITLQGSGAVPAATAVKTFALRDGDRVRIGTVLPYSEKAIYLEGHVLRPGRMPFTDGMRLADVLRSYRDLLPEPATRGDIVRLVPPDLHVETRSFDVSAVLIGNDNPPLQPLDTIRVQGRYEGDAPQVSVGGEVLRPGTYPLSEGMTAAELVRLAGGFKRSAMRDAADLSSYTVDQGEKVEIRLSTLRIGAAVEGRDASADVALKAGDVLTIHEITGFADIGESITLDGQVRFPGSYGFTEGEHLSALLRRAGGFRGTAYPEGAVLLRPQVRELEEKSRDELIRQIQASSATARLSPNLGGVDAGAQLALIKAQQDEIIAELKSHPPAGRMVISIGSDLAEWENTAADIEVRRGDVLTVPKRPGFVLVSGQVYNPTGVAWTPGRTAAWYLAHAGGANTSANRKNTFVIRANGSVVGRHPGGGWFAGDVLSTKLQPGDVVVVPQKIVGSSLLFRNLLTTAQLASSIAITAAVSGL